MPMFRRKPADKPDKETDPYDFDDPGYDTAPPLETGAKGKDDEELLARASEVGISKESLEGLPAEQVNAILDQFDDYLDLIASPEEKAEYRPPSKGGKKGGKRPKPKKAVPAAEESGGEEDEFEEEDLGGRGGKSVKALMKEIGALRGELEELRSGATRREKEALGSRAGALLDGFVAKYQRQAAAVFGTGERQNPVQRRKRQDVLRKMEVLAAGYEAAGMPIPGEQALFGEAVRATLGDDYAKIARAAGQQAAAERQTQFTARPQGRVTEPADNKQKAVQHVAAFMRERGMLEGQQPEPGKDEFPS